MTWLNQLSSPIRRIGRHWDSTLLGLMLTAMAGLGAYLLMPQPKYQMTLSPLPANAYSVTAAADTLAMEADMGKSPEESGTRQKKSARRRAKKPAKPPVLNLNKATAAQLDLLPGIGPKLAQRIIKHRGSQGAYTDVAQLMDVQGIGEKNFAKMKPYLKL